MNILSVNKFYWRKGGSEAVFFTEKALLEAHGHKVIPFSMQSDKNLPSAYEKYFVNEVDYTKPGLLNKINSAAKIIYSFEANKKMRWLLSENKVDVAHFHIFQHQISPSVFAPLREKNIPIILTLHDLKPLCPNYQMSVNGAVCERCKVRRFYHCFLHKCTKGSRFKSAINTVEMYFHYMMGYYQNVDKYIAVSQFYRNKMIEYGFAPDQLELLPNSVDTDTFCFSDQDDNYVLFAGRLTQTKGVGTLIEAAKYAPEIHIKIAGTGPDEEKFKQLAKQENARNIEFVGFQTEEKLIQLLARASFTVITTIIYENCPMTVLESLSMGKPVIGADIGGIPELINVGTDGFVYPPADAKALADNMRLLWQDKRKRQHMGKQGREKMLKHFHPQVHYQKLLKIYQQVIKKVS